MIRTLLKTITSFGWNTRLLRCAALSLLLYRAVTTAAQDADSGVEIDPLYSYHFEGLEQQRYEYQGEAVDYDYTWTLNNTLVITDLVRPQDTNDWTPVSIVYNPDVPNAWQPLILPPSPAPLPSHVQMLPPTYNTPFATSPDGRIDLYTVDYSVPNPDYTSGYSPGFHVLGLVDRTTGRVMTLPNVRMGNVAEIHWNVTNDTFLIKLQGGYGDIYYAYVSQLADVSQAKGILLRNSGPFADALQWSIYQAYGLDSTGRYLLADGYLHNTEFNPGDMRLLMVDMQTLTYEVISAKGYFNGAGFEKPDDQRILYMSKDGVFIYDRQTKTSVLLTDAINATDTPSGDFKRFHPEFSPNGRYLATLLTTDKPEETVFVYPIPPLP